jgi:hypothetical protein
MLLLWKLVDETQMPQSQEYTNTFIITYKLFLVGLRGRYFISNPDGRPCMYPGFSLTGRKKYLPSWCVNSNGQPAASRKSLSYIWSLKFDGFLVSTADICLPESFFKSFDIRIIEIVHPSPNFRARVKCIVIAVVYAGSMQFYGTG